jgi:hypothetical protein
MKPEVVVVVVVFTVFSLRVPEEASGRARARRKSRALNVSFNGRARTVRVSGRASGYPHASQSKVR